MLTLALANLMHHKVRTSLSVLAVAIAITLLLVLVGLSNGTLHEVSRRMQSVQAQVLVSDKYFDVASFSGGKLWEKEIAGLLALRVEGGPAVARVLPVFLGRMKFADQSQNVFGVHPGDFAAFAGARRLISGELFADAADPAQALSAGEADDAGGAPQGDLPVIIDQRLARAAGLGVGDTVHPGALPVRVVGVVETGVAGRVFAPINLLRAANGVAAPTAHLFFVQTPAGFDADRIQQVCDLIQQTTHRSATPVAAYDRILAGNFRTLTTFIGLVSAIALVICFLFICVTIYTSVLERAKEIAILQSLGAGRRLILRQTVQEALLLCAAGTLVGILASYAARGAIEAAYPLMNIEINPPWLVVAGGIGLGGGVLAALYPAYVALRHDPAEALSFE